jgi:hypothetical protein
MEELIELIEEFESFLLIFKRGSDSMYLTSGDQAKFKGCVMRASDLLDENLSKGNTYTKNLIHTVNSQTVTFIGGPSFLCVQEVIELMKAASIKIERIREIETQFVRERGSDVSRAVKICSCFHIVVRSLRSRYNNRPTITIADEYDVQDMLRALLAIEFDDIRDEEYSPSYAGGSSRIDFLLKNEKILVETKMTRKGLTDKKLGEELIIDIAKYKNHPDCGMIVCFIYDPKEMIKNRKGLAADLENLSTAELPIIVVIAP